MTVPGLQVPALVLEELDPSGQTCAPTQWGDTLAELTERVVGLVQQEMESKRVLVAVPGKFSGPWPVQEHLMEDYESGKLVRRTFDPDARQADALIRLRSGTGTSADMLLLLRHEWAESEYLRLNPDAAYETAHAHANEITNWWSAVREPEGIEWARPPMG